jgi:hypothetical protein
MKIVREHLYEGVASDTKRYDLSSYRQNTIHEFVAIGEKNDEFCSKVIIFKGDRMLYGKIITNLAFGKKKYNEKDEVDTDDTTLTNYEDTNKTFATILEAIKRFHYAYPDRGIFFKGNEDVKINLYKRMLTYNQSSIADLFNISILYNGTMYPFTVANKITLRKNDDCIILNPKTNKNIMKENINESIDSHKYDNVKFGPNVTRATQEMEDILIKYDIYKKLAQQTELGYIYETLQKAGYTTINESEEIKSKFNPYEEMDLNEDMSEKIKIGKQILKKLGL